jgi:hypothetical protein
MHLQSLFSPTPSCDTLNSMQRDRLHQLLIPVAALIPILPLILNGCSCGHDFDFHVLNWLEAARQFSHGNLFPHWTSTPAWNAGEPRFIFYPPLSWTIGAILGLILPWTWTPILYTWLILTAAGLTLHRLARSFASPTAAFLAAVFYLVNPYTLFTAYERTAYSELLAAVFIPLLLHAILRPAHEALRPASRITIPRIAIPLALLWLTNAPAAVMSSYALALLATIRLITAPADPPLDPRTNTPITQSRLSLGLTTAAGTLLGLTLAAYYIIPAAVERRYVQINMAILPGLSIQDNTLFHHTTTGITDPAALADAALHDTVLHAASIIAIILLTLTTIALIAAFRSTTTTGAPPMNPGAPSSRRSFAANRGPQRAAVARWGGMVGIVRSTTAPAQIQLRLTLYTLATLTLVIAFLLTPISLPFWRHLPELAFLQFPWRLLAILAAVLALTLAIAFNAIQLKPITTSAIAIAIATALTWPAYTLFRQPCDPEDTVAAQVTLFNSRLGTDPTDEYTPLTADNDALAHTNPPYWFSPDPTSPAPANIPHGPAPTTLNFKSPIPQTLILNLRDYPAWHVTLNDALVITRQPRPDGLIAIPIPAGRSTLAITYDRLKDQTIGATISLLSLILLLLISLFAIRSAPHNRRTSVS